MIVSKNHMRRHSQRECPPGWRVCLPLMPNTSRELRAKTHVSPQAILLLLLLLLLLFSAQGISDTEGEEKNIIIISSSISISIQHNTGSRVRAKRSAVAYRCNKFASSEFVSMNLVYFSCV